MVGARTTIPGNGRWAPGNQTALHHVAKAKGFQAGEANIAEALIFPRNCAAGVLFEL